MADLEEEDMGGLREIKDDDDDYDEEGGGGANKGPNKLIIALLSLLVFVGLFLFFRKGKEAPEEGPAIITPEKKEENR